MDDHQAFAELHPAVASWFELASSREPLHALAGGDNEHNEGRFRLDPKLLRKLLTGLYYSRDLIATYYAVIGILLALLTIRHWLPRLLKSRASAQAETKVLLEESQETYGSADAAIADDRYPRADSRKSVLQHVGAYFDIVRSRIHSILIYQPKPIPIVNKTLPPNETSLAVLLLIGINVFYTLFKIEFDLNLIFVFASRCGLLFVVNLPLLYLLAAKNQPIKYLTGHSYESLNIYHRRLGEYMCLLGVLHAVGMIFVYITLRKHDFSLIEFLTNRVVVLGLGGFICYESLYTTSLASFRQAWYELFLALHIFLQLGALVFVFFHHSGSRFYVGIALGIFCVDRLVFRYFLKTNTLPASAIIHPDKKTVTLTISIDVPNKRRRLMQLIRGIRASWQPAEHVFISVPSLGHSYLLQAHPFTIASPAPERQSTTADLQLLIRAQDGFSRQLLHYAQQNPTFRVRIDGPYGTSTGLDMLRDGDLSILVAGGSGIAVVWPLVSALLAEEESFIERTDGERTNRKRRGIVLIWVVRESEHIQWLGQETLNDAQARGVEVIIPAPTEYGGRPKLENIMEMCVRRRAPNLKVRAVCSGPDGLNRTVQNTCSEMVGHGADVEIEVHKYGW